MNHRKKKSWKEWLWDAWCVVSLIGIWPRFIEPLLLSVTRISLSIPRLPAELVGLKILQFSDLHWSQDFSAKFCEKLISKINQLKPDLIVFTGDMLCRSMLENEGQLTHFLSSLNAPLGRFAVLGNHDYAQFITVNARGDYDIEQESQASTIEKGFKRLAHPVQLSRQITAEAHHVALHQPLLNLLRRASFQLLNNACQFIPFKQAGINICGVGEYTTGQLDTKQAFKQYNPLYPGIILCHNPDAVPALAPYPGDLILSGHTHGGQVNLPGLWNKFTYMENPHLKRGLKREGNKWVYINRGIGSVMKFRWFSLPEITLFTLQTGKI